MYRNAGPARGRLLRLPQGPTMTSAAALTLLALLPAAGPPPAPTLASKIENVLNRPEYKGARWGVLVVDAATGKTLYAHNADQLFAPASVTKLYSCAAALVALGADHRFETPVYRRGELKGGRLTGDLILVGKGDLTMGGRDANGRMEFADDDHIYSTPAKMTTGLTNTDPLAGLKDLAKQVKEAGVKQVTGDVLVDDRMFELTRGSGSGPGILTPLLVNDNVIDVIV